MKYLLLAMVILVVSVLGFNFSATGGDDRGIDRAVYCDYVNYFFQPGDQWTATGNTFFIPQGYYNKIRFFGWHGAISEDDVITVGLLCTHYDIHYHSNNQSFYNTSDVGAYPDDSRFIATLLTKRADYMISPWFDVPPDANFVGIYLKGNGVATYHPQEQGIELAYFPDGIIPDEPFVTIPDPLPPPETTTPTTTTTSVAPSSGGGGFGGGGGPPVVKKTPKIPDWTLDELRNIILSLFPLIKYLV